MSDSLPEALLSSDNAERAKQFVDLDNAASKSQWKQGDLLNQKPWREYTLADVRSIILEATGRTFSVSYLSRLKSTAKTFDWGLRENAISQGACWHDCDVARRAADDLEADPTQTLYRFLDLKKDGSIEDPEAELRQPPQRQARTPQGRPTNVASVEDPFFDTNRVLPKAWKARWKQIESKTNKLADSLKVGEAVFAISIDPEGLPRISGFERITDEAQRDLIHFLLFVTATSKQTPSRFLSAFRACLAKVGTAASERDLFWRDSIPSLNEAEAYAELSKKLSDALDRLKVAAVAE